MGEENLDDGCFAACWFVCRCFGRSPHWDPSFRVAVRDNNYIAAKTVQEVTWDGFPMTKKYFEESKESADVKETKAEQLIQFCFIFFQNFNVRMAEQKDIETMEACTVFDPRPKRKAKNKNSYLSKISVLLAAFGSGLSKNVVQITNGAAQWFCSPQYNENDDEDVEVLECFRKLHLSSNPDVAAFASWGLNVLKNLLATALVENFFSTVTQLKTKYRGNLKGDSVQVAVVMRTEPDFKDVAFDAYYNEFREFSNCERAELRGRQEPSKTNSNSKKRQQLDSSVSESRRPSKIAPPS